MQSIIVLILLAAQEPRATAAGELAKLARTCADGGDFSGARRELRRAIAISESATLKEELAKLSAKDDAVRPEAVAGIAAERKRAHDAAAEALAGDATNLALLKVHLPGCESAFEKLGLAWFATYSSWVAKGDVAKLEAGQEEIDGAWRDTEAVAALNRKHSTWEDPWVLDDGVHELRTTLPLRSARRLLHYITAYRAFFLSQFAGDWDLRPPAGKLPIVATAKQAELRDLVLKHTKGAMDVTQSVHAAAYYLYTPEPLNPCFVTLEPTNLKGEPFTITVDDVIRTLTHELTHQICFEYSKHDSDRTRSVEHQMWAVEGLAVFVPNYALERGAWRLTRVRSFKMGEKAGHAPFAWAKENAGKMPSIDLLVATRRAQFTTGENYMTSATLVYFLLEGGGGRHRRRLLSLLDTVHRIRDKESTFDEAFKEIDRKALQEEFRKFVEAIPIE